MAQYRLPHHLEWSDRHNRVNISRNRVRALCGRLNA